MTGPLCPDSQKCKLSLRIDSRVLVLILLLGVVLRLVHVIQLDFPLNDGGFFYQLVLDIQAAGYRLPDFTTYNQSHIPFAYPPLALYLAAFLSDGLNFSLLTLLRLLPATISILTMLAFYLLSRTLLTNQQAIFATLGFSFLPTAFDWLIVGGGLTRSFGYLFAILTLWQVCQLLRSNALRHTGLATLFASLTVLSHPGTAWFALYAACILVIFHWKWELAWLFKFLWVGFGTIALTAPWWLTILQRHGLAVLAHPFQTESLSLASLLIPFTFLFTNEFLLSILAFCGLLGILVLLRNRKFTLPAWLFLTFLLESRLGPTYSVVPMSLLIGYGIDQVIWPLLSGTNSEGSSRWISGFTKIASAYFLVTLLINAYLGINYRTVTPGERDSMAWIAANTPPDSRFLLLTGQPHYGIDPVSEWFPALSQRTSLTTPQGHEWLPGTEFTRRVTLHAELQNTFLDCPLPYLDCVLEWADEAGLNYTHIFIPASTPVQLPSEAGLDLWLVHESPGGLVFTRK